MTQEKPKAPTIKNQPAPARPGAGGGAPGVPPKPPPMFRTADWICFGITSLVMLLSYLYTLAPDLTLQDSGELAVASMYAGVPHPPGYPVWTIYTWLFTVLLPFSNIAYRVAISSALAGALTCGLVAIMVSRGSSMLMEGITEFKDLAKRWENEICVVTGFVSGALIGFDGFMWSQAVIVEVYTFTALSLVGVLVLLMRWVYAPQQHRYLYLAWFVFGIAFNNHQSVLVCALAMEVLIVWVQPKLGRDLLLGNTLIWIIGLIGERMGLVTTLRDNPPVMIIFCLIGIGSALGFLWLWFRTKQVFTAMHWGMACFFAFAGGVLFYLFMPIASMTNPPMNWAYPRTVAGFFHAFTRGQYERIHPTTGTGTGLELIYTFCTRVAGQFKMLAEGTLEEINPLYLLLIPLSVLAFLALRRAKDPETPWLRSGTISAAAWVGISFLLLVLREIDAEAFLAGMASEKFVAAVWVLVTLVVALGVGCAAVALTSVVRCVPLREAAWLVGLVAFWIVMGPFLIVLFNPQPDRQSLSLIKVFFTPSHMFVAMGLGYALTLLLATLAVAYENVRRQAVLVMAVLAGFALVAVVTTYARTQYAPPRAAAVLAFVLILAVAVLKVLARDRAPVGALLVALALMPGVPAFSHWSENEQRGHLFGFWFGHDMFTPPFKGSDGKPLYPEMDKDTILFGGTDPGRFCPTYMIFCESFIPPEKRLDPKFDRRDVYIITQNALADGTYLNYIRAHYFRSAQIDPPFFSEFVRSERERSLNYKTNLLARMLLPLDDLFLGLGDQVEKRRRAGSSLFKESDILNVAGFAKALKSGDAPAALSKYLFDSLSPEVREEVKSLVGEKLAASLAQDLNRLMDSEYELNQRLPEMQAELGTLTNELATLKGLGKADSRQFRKKQQRAETLEKEVAAAVKIVPFYTPERFKDVQLSDYVKQFIAQKPQLHSRIRLTRLLLEEAYPEVFVRSQGGLYPDREIYTPSIEDSQKCFNDYMADAQERMKKGQLKPGEDVRVIDNKVQVSGQVAVMAINGLLTKVIFDHNPNNEFYVEESFPLDWMFPHLTPYGIIMKINRNPVPELTEDMVRRDHEFWSQYSERLIGNWITYDTTISNICAFAEQTYVHHDYTKFKGDPKFVRDDDAQKAFSKLRSSIGGLYAWRIDNARTEVERQRALKEAEFAFKQAYAFCPYSPEALYRYVNILLRGGRVDEARLMAITSKKLDPANSGLDRLIEELERIKKQQQAAASSQGQLAPLEAEFRAHPSNVNNALQLANTLAQLGQTERVRQIADVLLANSAADANAVYFTVQVYSQLRDTAKLELALQNWARVNPTPEAWMDLAAVKTLLNKTPEALAAVKTCLDLNAKRLAANPKASNLALLARTDERLRPLQAQPEFQRILATNL